jgi:hypothetical protein
MMLEVKAAAAKRRQADAQQQQADVFVVEDQPGITEPFGLFDPLNLAPRSKIKFRQYRSAELKHGRVAMLASVGLVAQHWIRFPGGSFDEVPNGIYAVTTLEGSLGLAFTILPSLVLEFAVWAQDPGKEVGDFGDPLNAGMDSLEMKNRELNNGRFAMFATMGILIAELVTGKDAVEQLGIDVAAS